MARPILTSREIIQHLFAVESDDKVLSTVLSCFSSNTGEPTTKEQHFQAGILLSRLALARPKPFDSYVDLITALGGAVNLLRFSGASVKTSSKARKASEFQIVPFDRVRWLIEPVFTHFLMGLHPRLGRKSSLSLTFQTSKLCEMRCLIQISEFLFDRETFELFTQLEAAEAKVRALRKAARGDLDSSLQPPLKKAKKP